MKKENRYSFFIRSNDRGFTLVEFIVVFLILAILAAILIPLLLGYIDESKSKQDVINAKALMNAMQTQLSEDYVNYLTGDSESDAYYENFKQSIKGDGNNHADIDLRKSDFTKKVLSKAGVEKPYALVMYSGYSKNIDDIPQGLDVFSIVYWPTKDSFPLYYDIDSNSWEYGSLYTAGYMIRGSESTSNDDKKNINRIKDGHKHAGEKIRVYILCYDSPKDSIILNDEIKTKMNEYND